MLSGYEPERDGLLCHRCGKPLVREEGQEAYAKEGTDGIWYRLADNTCTRRACAAEEVAVREAVIFNRVPNKLLSDRTVLAKYDPNADIRIYLGPFLATYLLGSAGRERMDRSSFLAPVE